MGGAYYFVEIEAPAGYQLDSTPLPLTLIKGTQEQVTLNFPNQKTLTQVSGTKTWADQDNAAEKRSDSVTVYLLADGEQVNAAVIYEETEWAFQFTDLPVYAGDGHIIQYTVIEETVANYTASYEGYNIINTYTPPEEESPNTGSHTHAIIWSVAGLLSLSAIVFIQLNKGKKI